MSDRIKMFRFATQAMLVGFLICSLFAQQSDKRGFAFRGKVEQVNTTTKRLTVHSEPIEGWMGEMTMAFAVDDDALFNRVKAGDQITAKVYEGEFTLHDVQVVPPEKTAAPPGAATQGGMRLEELEQMALANNPTVAQVQANLRVAAGLARQAGLYPNPTVGYYGDEIRGGYLGGGKQARRSCWEVNCVPPVEWRNWKQPKSRLVDRFSVFAFRTTFGRCSTKSSPRRDW